MKISTLFPLLLMPFFAISQPIDTLGSITLSERINKNMHQKSIFITIDKFGDIHLPLSARKSNIRQVLDLSDKKKWIETIREFEAINKSRKASKDTNTTLINATVNRPTIIFEMSGEKMYAYKPKMEFYYFLIPFESKPSVGNLMISVSKLEDTLAPEYAIEPFQVFLSEVNIKELKKVLEAYK